jgi:hypothetical protein
LESVPEIKTCYIEVDYGVRIRDNQKREVKIYPIPANDFLILEGTNDNPLFEVLVISNQKMQIPI